MDKKLRPVRVGDPITDTVWNELTAKLNRSRLNVASCGMLGLTEHPQGRTLSLRIRKPVPARLSGSSSPYSWTALIESSGGGYDDRTAGLTGGSENAYEANGKSGLDGKVVLLDWTAARDWRFQWVGYAPPNFNWTFNVSGCTGAIAGALIEAKQSGVLIDSCTTGDGTGGTILGRCVLSVPSGSYDITITPPTGSGLAATTFTESISSAKTTNKTLVADGTSVCWSCCNVALPQTIYTTDADGLIPLTYVGTGGAGHQYEYMGFSPVASTRDQTGFAVCAPAVSPSSVRKGYRLNFMSGCQVRLQYITHINRCSTLTCGIGFDGDWAFATPASIASENIYFAVFKTLGAGNCDPLNFDITLDPSQFFFPDGSCNPLPMPGGGGTLTFTS